MQSLLVDVAVSVSELKKNPLAVLRGAHGSAVAILNHNCVMGYMVPADVFEAMMERLDDLDLAELVRARRHETPVPVGLEDLQDRISAFGTQGVGQTTPYPARPIQKTR